MCKPAVLKLQFYAFLLLEHTHVFLFISTCMCKEVRPAIYISVFLLLFYYYSFLKISHVFSLFTGLLIVIIFPYLIVCLVVFSL